jgi:hypothetical protein
MTNAEVPVSRHRTLGSDAKDLPHAHQNGSYRTVKTP